MAKARKKATKDVAEEPKQLSITMSLFERLVLSSFLPQQSSIQEGKMIREITDVLALSDEEIEKSKADFFPNGAVKFNNKEYAESYRKEITFPDHKWEIIKKALEIADKKEIIPINEDIHRDYELIMEYFKDE